MLIAVDTGGTKTLITNFDQSGNIGKIIKFPTPKHQDQYIATLKGILEQEYSNQSVEALIVGLPGIIKNGVALWCNNLGWENFAVKTELTGVLGNISVLIENDANLAGLAETRILNPMPISSLYVTISTGIGTGIITNGHIDPGTRSSEGGRTVVEFAGEMHEWESFASGKAIHEAYGKYAHDIKDDQTWTEIADRISRGFLAIIPTLQPDTIIIGGSIGMYFDHYRKQLEKIIDSRLPSHIPLPHFHQAKHPEQAVIYGCYYYALDCFASQ